MGELSSGVGTGGGWVSRAQGRSCSFLWASWACILPIAISIAARTRATSKGSSSRMKLKWYFQMLNRMTAKSAVAGISSLVVMVGALE